MIDRSSITAWGVERPWPKKSSVEQDLVICRAIVSIFAFQTGGKPMSMGPRIHLLDMMAE